MNYLFSTPLEMREMYDLKGSQFGRSARSPEETVQKDNDWISRERRLNLSFAEADQLKTVHVRDADFLCSHGFMDYSILLGIADLDKKKSRLGVENGWLSEDGSEQYFLGLIDFLVEYGMWKRAEHLMYEARGVGQKASVVDPNFYAER